MKLPKAVRLPSGSYRVQIMVDGQRISLTGPDPKKLQAQAAQIKAGMVERARHPERMTLREAAEQYIADRDGVLSPSTITSYRKIARTHFQDLADRPVERITAADFQREVNRLAKIRSPKTTIEAYSFFRSSMRSVVPNFDPQSALPQKRKPDPHIPDEREIEAILAVSRGTAIELPVMLAVWLGLRASEIVGLTWDSLEQGGTVLHVKEAVVNTDNGLQRKSTKTTSGDRRLRVPPAIRELIERQPRTDERIVHLSGQAIYKRFTRLLEKNGLPHCRFHDLRHANASVMLMLGVPDKYAMSRMGHSSTNMLKMVYQHLMDGKETDVADAVDAFFESLSNDNLHTELHTESESPDK